MKTWRAINLTSQKLEKLIKWLKWADYYEICDIIWNKPNKPTSTMIFQAADYFVEKYIIPDEIEIEIGKEITIILTLPIPGDVIKNKNTRDFMITGTDEESMKIAVGKIAWHLLCNNPGPIPVYAENDLMPTEGIKIRLFEKRDADLLMDLLSLGFGISYQDFKWTAYNPE